MERYRSAFHLGKQGTRILKCIPADLTLHSVAPALIGSRQSVPSICVRSCDALGIFSWSSEVIFV